ncbi:complement component receptor 1-like protein isoform X1 [Arapaima gigas]
MKRSWVNVTVFISLFLASVSAQRSLQDCGPLRDYPNAHPLSRQQNQRRVRYECAFGYKPVRGSPFVQCKNGRWSALTLQCARKPCGSAGDILNGYFEYEGDALFGDQAFAICNEGYRLKGTGYRLCGDSGWEGEVPTCEQIREEVTCPVPTVDNAVRTSGDNTVFSPGDTVSFSCQPGYELHGFQEITCTADGEWDLALPVCLPIKKGNCGTPPPYPNMEVVDENLTQRDFSPGYRVRYRCVLGYIRSGRASPSSYCINGVWTPVGMECERKSCGSAGEIFYGHYKYEGTLFGDKAFAVCNDGYQLVGRNYRQCLEMGWDGRDPVCEAVMCDNPPEVVDGKWTGPLEDPFKYGTVVTYQCYRGELIGKAELHCTRDGTWSGPAPQCKEITCGDAVVDNGEKISGFGTRYQFKHAVSFKCKKGYTLRGHSTVRCGANGQWKPKLPTCIPIKCPRLSVQDGFVRPNYRAYTRIVEISCNPGFELFGEHKMICSASGTWCPLHCKDCDCRSNQPPQCVKRR